MFDPQKLLEQFLGYSSSPADQAKSGSKSGSMSPDFTKGLAGGAALGGIAGLLLGSKGGRKFAGKAVKLGGAAAVAGLAYQAWQNWQRSKEPASPQPMKDVTPVAEQPKFLPSNKASRDAASLAILRAMIAAAKADGAIDAAEQQRIFAKLDDHDLDQEAKAFVIDELRRPLDIDAVVAGATSPELALEIYTASRLAIDPDHPAEKAYLDMLAARLRLDPGFAMALESEAAKALAN